MLLYAVNRLEEPEDPARQVPLQAPPDLAVTLALAPPSGPIGPGLGMEVHPPQDDGVEGTVELAVSAPIQPIANDPSGRGGESAKLCGAASDSGRLKAR